jgi:diguanylate cyclase (GGDEF)-like protein
MQNFAHTDNKNARFISIILLYIAYIVISMIYHNQAVIAVAALSTLPVIAGGLYFGSYHGMVTAGLLVLANLSILSLEGYSFLSLFSSPDTLVGAIALVFIGWVVGKLGFIIRERREAIAKLEQYELQHQIHMEFLQQLNSITNKALEANNLQSTLEILTEQMVRLFKADDGFFAFWNSERKLPVPMVAYGSMKDGYSYIQFEPGDRVPSTYAIEAEHPIAIPDLNHSPYIEPQIAAIYPSQSMLVIPLIAQNRKLGSILLGYNQRQTFEQNLIDRAKIVAEQVASVLSKSLLLEEERKQVKQLTALHDSALIAIDEDNEDELINRVTDIIGQNLFPDNFGIFLLDEQNGILHAHPSYRFFTAEERHIIDVPIEKGITGLVARTGQAQRIGNVRLVKEYFDMDERTVSELCVPIKFKESVLGVINAESTKRDAFTEDDERLLITLAGQIATAVEQIRKAQAERKWLDQLAHSNDLIYALAQITTHIEKAFSIDDIIRNLGAELHKIDLTCILAVYDRERGTFTINYTSMSSEDLGIVESGLDHPLIKYTFSRDRLKLENVLYPTALSTIEDEIEMLFSDTRRQGVTEVLRQIGVGPETEPLRLPLIFEENLLGILWIWGKGLTRADLPIMSIFAKQIGVSLERARLFQEVQSLALTDSLTGLQNRRSLFELGRVEFARAQRMERPFCCMMLDLDHFKEINDKHGHLIGDHVLQEFAKRCKDSIREIDLVGRYGGEELIILLPEADRPTSIQVAERLLHSIACTPIRVFNKEISVTASIGVACQDENTTDLETLIARADQAMYIAKHKGRNRVAMSK